MSVDRIAEPGPEISMVVPKLEKLERAPVRVVDATAMTFEQLAGVKPEVSALLLPAATTTVAAGSARISAPWPR